MGIQELQTPELQPLSMESKAALALLKYLPLTPQVIPQVPTLPPCLHAHCLLFQICVMLTFTWAVWSAKACLLIFLAACLKVAHNAAAVMILVPEPMSTAIHTVITSCCRHIPVIT